jgi:UDP-N-acetylmuramate dehydrogenase
MQLKENVSLKPYNTFGINVSAKYFANFTSLDELKELLTNSKFQTPDSYLILGGGSNILFTKDFDGFVLKNELKGIGLVKEDDTFYYVKANAGENWHQFVLHCISNNYAGIENLSLIPGNVGASPMQNIGAYGVEIKDVFYELEALPCEG